MAYPANVTKTTHCPLCGAYLHEDDMRAAVHALIALRPPGRPRSTEVPVPPRMFWFLVVVLVCIVLAAVLRGRP